LLFILFDLKKVSVNCTSVLPVLFFTSSRYFEGKVRTSFFGGFYCFFSEL